MSLRKYLLFVLLTTVFHLVGNQTELGQPLQQVLVKVGDTAVLPCNVSPPMNGETEDGLYIQWVTNDGLVCEFTDGKSHPYGDYRNRTEISKEKNSKLYHLIINKTRLSDDGKYYCTLDKPDLFFFGVASVQLIVQGRVENCELYEGENLSIPLCCLSSPYIEFCGLAGNSTADGVCQGHVKRLTVQNGFVTLSNFTAKDQGKYIVREKMGGGVVLTLTLTLKTKPVGTQNIGWHWSVGVIAGIFALLLLLLVYISVRAIKWYKRRQMEREMRRLAEQLNEQIPLNEI